MTILSATLLLRHSLGLAAEADAVRRAVERVLAQGHRTYDVMDAGCTKVGTAEMGERIARAIEEETEM